MERDPCATRPGPETCGQPRAPGYRNSPPAAAARTGTLTITHPAPQNFDIRLSSATFGGTNARIVATFAPGTYVIEVTTAFEGEVGAYTLSLVAAP